MATGLRCIPRLGRRWRVTLAMGLLLATTSFVPALRAIARAEEFDSCALQGTVADADGKPLAGVTVSLNRFEGAAPAPDNKYETTTDDDGRYELPVRFRKGQTVIVREVFATMRGFVRSAPPLKMSLVNGARSTLDFRLEKGEVLAGRLQLPVLPWERRLPADKIVRVLEVSGPGVDHLTINARCHLVRADNKFELYVPAGEYTLSVINYQQPAPTWTNIKAPSSDLVLEQKPFEWTEANVGEVFDSLWQAMDLHYSYFSLKHDVDWQALRDKYRPIAVRAKDLPEFVATLRDLLAPLDDLHVWIDTPRGIIPTSQGGSYSYNGNRQITLAQLEETAPCGRFAIVGKTKPDGFGYFLMTQQSAATPANVQTAVAAIRALQDAPGFIVDLRMANGGSEPLAQEIARLFCAQDTVYALSKRRNGPAHDAFGPVNERILPATEDPYTKPVVRLIGPGAVSSGEGFVKMMQCLPQVTTVGMPTRGASGNPQPWPLGRTGLSVYFSRWVDMLPNGRTFEGYGIPPDIRAEVPEGVNATSDFTLERALAALREKVSKVRQ